MTTIPIIASAADVPGAVRHAQRETGARWYVARRAEALGRGDLIPKEWGITAAVAPVARERLTRRQGRGKMGRMDPITAAGPDWDTDLHPRDRKGRFIEKLDLINVFSVEGGSIVTGRGVAVGNSRSAGGEDFIHVQYSDGPSAGKTVKVPASKVESAPPSKARLDDADAADKARRDEIQDPAYKGGRTGADITQAENDAKVAHRLAARESGDERSLSAIDTDFYASPEGKAFKDGSGATGPQPVGGDSNRLVLNGKLYERNGEKWQYNTKDEKLGPKDAEPEAVAELDAFEPTADTPDAPEAEAAPVESQFGQAPEGIDQHAWDVASNHNLETLDPLGEDRGTFQYVADSEGVNFDDLVDAAAAVHSENYTKPEPDAPAADAPETPAAPATSDEMKRYLVEERGYGQDVVDNLTTNELISDYEMEGGENVPEAEFELPGDAPERSVMEDFLRGRGYADDVVDHLTDEELFHDWEMEGGRDSGGTELSADEVADYLREEGHNVDTYDVQSIMEAHPDWDRGQVTDEYEAWAEADQYAYDPDWRTNGSSDDAEGTLEDDPDYQADVNPDDVIGENVNVSAIANQSPWRPGDPDPDNDNDYALAVLSEADGYQEVNLEDDAQDDRLDALMTHLAQGFADGRDESELGDEADALRDFLIREGYADGDEDLPSRPASGGGESKFGTYEDQNPADDGPDVGNGTLEANPDFGVQVGQTAREDMQPFRDMLDVDSNDGAWASGISAFQFDNLIDSVDTWEEDNEAVDEVTNDRLVAIREYLDRHGIDSDPEDIVRVIEARKQANELGWAQQEQLTAILNGESLDEQNPNALRSIADFLQNNPLSDNTFGEGEYTTADLASDISEYLDGAFNGPDAGGPDGPEIDPETGDPLNENQVRGQAIADQANETLTDPDAQQQFEDWSAEAVVNAETPEAGWDIVQEFLDDAQERHNDRTAKGQWAAADVDSAAELGAKSGENPGVGGKDNLEIEPVGHPNDYDFGGFRVWSVTSVGRGGRGAFPTREAAQAYIDSYNERYDANFDENGMKKVAPEMPDSSGYTPSVQAKILDRYSKMSDQEIADEYEFQRGELQNYAKDGVDGAQFNKTEFRSEALRDELDKRGLDNKAARKGQVAKVGEASPGAGNTPESASDAPAGPTAPAQPAGHDEATHAQLLLMARSADKDSVDHNRADAENELRILIDKVHTGEHSVADAHKEMAALMTRLKLGGKQRKRYRELLDKYFGQEGGGDSAKVQADAVADNLSDSNPVKERLKAKAAEKKAAPDAPGARKADDLKAGDTYERGGVTYRLTKDPVVTLNEVHLSGVPVDRPEEGSSPYIVPKGTKLGPGPAAKPIPESDLNAVPAGTKVRRGDDVLTKEPNGKWSRASDESTTGGTIPTSSIVAWSKQSKGPYQIEKGEATKAPVDMDDAELNSAIEAEGKRLFKETGKYGGDSPAMKNMLRERDRRRRISLLRGEGPTNTINTPAGAIRAGDVITYDDRNGGPVRMLVESVADDVKNGESGFDGVLVDANNNPLLDQWGGERNHWGYADQALAIVQKAPAGKA